MKNNKRIFISQCMIVKDEEKNIEKALSWGKGVMWEQIVIDTGSTDRTAELAGKLGAKVFHLEWAEDFSAAKNYAIQKARGDWIVFLDADEYMTEEDAKKLPYIFAQLSRKGFDGSTALLHNLDDTGRIFSSCSHLRFFRNIPDIRYKRRIHEQLVSLSGRELQVMDGTQEFSIFHTGYQRAASTEKKKSGRNRRMLQRELEEYPDDPELMGYMGDECFDDGELEEAERWYRQAVAHMPGELKEHDQRSATTFVRLLMTLTERETIGWPDVQDMYQQGVQAFPKEADLDYMAGRFLVMHGSPEEAVEYLETALGKLEAYGSTNKALFLAGNLGDACDLLAKSCYETGQLQKCVTYAVEHLKCERYEMKPLVWLLKALFHEEEQIQDQEKCEAVMGFLAKLYDLPALKDRLFVMKAAQKAGCSGFAGYVKEHYFTPDEQKMLGIQEDDKGAMI